MKKKYAIGMIGISLILASTGCKKENCQTENNNKLSENQTDITNKPSTDQSEDITETSDEPYREEFDVMSLYKDVVLGNTEFVSTDEGDKEVNIKEFNYWGGGNQDNVSWSRFTVVDMDNDGTDEIVAEVTINEDACIEVLHYDEKVYGYQFNYRALNQLKTDGTFVQSSGAADSNCATIKFDKNKYTIETVSDSNFEEKVNAEWYEFNEKNINDYVK